LPGVEAHAERRRMRAQQRDRLGELVAAVAPAELLVRDIALMAIGEPEIVLPGMGEPVGLSCGRSSASRAGSGEIELVQQRVPIHAATWRRRARRSPYRSRLSIRRICAWVGACDVHGAPMLK
jgi:hypothetical protein